MKLVFACLTYRTSMLVPNDFQYTRLAAWYMCVHHLTQVKVPLALFRKAMREAHMPDLPAPEAYATVQGLREQIGQKANAILPVPAFKR